MCSSQCAVLFLLPLSSLPNSSALLLAAAASLCPSGPACYSLASNTFLPSVLLIQCMPFPMIMAMCPWAWGHQSQMLWNLFFSLLLYIVGVWLAYLDLSHKRCRVHLRTSTWFPHLHLSEHRAQLRAELATECSRLFHHTNVCFAKLKKNSRYLNKLRLSESVQAPACVPSMLALHHAGYLRIQLFTSTRLNWKGALSLSVGHRGHHHLLI